ncbi:FUSC family protein [Aquabacter cavernae]|uniref:FUSC family protein n=1 Tax=Aquabacter cavernae TaxID=2496029 RepID=UPI0013DFCEEB|nr:FUSC family protein [Aquabacter cavernae]
MAQRLDSARIGRSAILGAGATVPAFLCLWAGLPEVGFSASFGAYLLCVCFPVLSQVDAWPKLIATSVLFGLSATIGAVCGTNLVALLPVAVLFALWQARTELVPGSLRVAVALATLVMLLSTSPLPGMLNPWTYGLALGAGALWQSLLVGALQPVGDTGRLTLWDDLTRPWRHMRRAERFDGVMMGLGAVGAVICSLIPMSHSGWLLTTALRVMKPSRAETMRRMGQRAFGTLGGALVAMVLLSVDVPLSLHAALLGVILWGMLLVGAKRYGIYTFCLTIVALNFNVGSPDMSFEVGLHRVLFSLAGIALGLAGMLALPREEER